MNTQPMPSLSLPAARSFPFRRFLRDAGITTVFNVMIGVAITLIIGQPGRLYQQVVYSICIGTIAFLIIDFARLTMWNEPGWHRKRLVPFLGVLLAAAPISNYVGLLLGSLILGRKLPAIASLGLVRWGSDVMFTLLAICAAVLLFINREHVSRVKAEAAQEKARAEAVARQAVQAQLQLLQAQVEPHMLFNTLANLQGLIALDPARASNMLDQLIRYLRATLSSSRAEITTLAQEFDLLDAYLGLMEVRMGERLRFTLLLPDALRGASVPPMLLQPLVENAIIHGLEPKIGGGELLVRAELSGNVLELTVSDTGLGLQAFHARPGTGVGLSNTRERLRGLYGERAGLTLEPASPQGALARLTLPLEPP
jgi:hypothetical protein